LHLPPLTKHPIPEKARFQVSEVIDIVARELELTPGQARGRIWRRINAGTIRTQKVIGPTIIPRDELLRILIGDIE